MPISKMMTVSDLHIQQWTKVCIILRRSCDGLLISCVGVVIGFDPTSYMVSESAGTVSFVIVKFTKNQACICQYWDNRLIY